jgi:hypothetical protein
MSVRLSACISAASIGQISVKFGVGDYYGKMLRNFKLGLKSGKNMGQFV